LAGHQPCAYLIFSSFLSNPQDKEAHEEELRRLEDLAAQREARQAGEAAAAAKVLQDEIDKLKATLASVKAYQERQVRAL
jgi:hypothetical protein